jgi:putative two-component system response regulator
MSPLILIIDDEPVARRTLAALLAASGYQLEFAVNGREGLQRARVLQPDAILLDVMMPEQDGFETCRQLRADATLSEVPILLITALDDRDSRLAGLAAGADDFLTKPFDSAELALRLRTITRLNRYRQLLTERMRFQWLIDQADDGYLRLDVAGRVQYANAKAASWLGHASDTLVGSDFVALAGQQYRCEPALLWAQWHTALAMHPLYLVRPETETARVIWLQVEAFALPNEPAQIVRLRDVTTTMTTRQDMRKFHTVISHKFRTPLNHLINSLDFLTQSDMPLSAQDTAYFLDTAYRAAQRLFEQTKEIFQYVEAPVSAQAGNPAMLTTLPQKLQRLQEELKGVTLTYTTSPELAVAQLTLTEYGLDLILLELLGNAQKFHPTHQPTVQVTVVPDTTTTLCLTVQDDGLTLSPQQLQGAFLPYLQAEKNFTGEVAGMVRTRPRRHPHLASEWASPAPKPPGWPGNHRAAHVTLYFWGCMNRPQILIIDDEAVARLTIEALLAHENYTIQLAANGVEGLALALTLRPDVILLDVMMPKLDGFEVCRQLRATPTLAEIPILLITSLDDRDSRLEGLRAGADDFITKPFDTLELLARLQTILRLNRYRRLLEERSEVERLNAELLNAYDKTIEGWSRALDLRDKETEGHSQRVTDMTLQLARLAGFTNAETLRHIWRGALLHDVGKLGIPDAILLKPGPLTPEEWEIMRRHPVYAHDWLSPIQYLLPALDIPYCHHEKWDGSGYPRGLKGEEIPPAVRLFSVVDVWDALCSARPYRPAWTKARAREHIATLANTAFDPQAVALFLDITAPTE